MQPGIEKNKSETTAGDFYESVNAGERKMKREMADSVRECVRDDERASMRTGMVG